MYEVVIGSGVVPWRTPRKSTPFAAWFLMPKPIHVEVTNRSERHPAGAGYGSALGAGSQSRNGNGQIAHGAYIARLILQAASTVALTSMPYSRKL